MRPLILPAKRFESLFEASVISKQNIVHPNHYVDDAQNRATALLWLSSRCYNAPLNSDKPDYRFLLLNWTHFSPVGT